MSRLRPVASRVRPFAVLVLAAVPVAWLALSSGCSGGQAAGKAGDPADFSGTFAGEGLRVELHRSGSGGYEGTLARGGRSFGATADVAAAGGLEGEFRDGGSRFSFAVTKVPGPRDAIRLVTGGAIYELRRQEAANPLGRTASSNPLAEDVGAGPEAADGGDAVASGAASARQAPAGGTAPPAGNVPAAGTVPSAGTVPAADPGEVAAVRAAEAETSAALERAPAFTKVYKHPAGVYFVHPDDWRVQGGAEGAVQLVPPDLATIQGQQAELLAVLGEDAAGVQRVDDPQVVGTARAFVSESLPYLRAEGQPKTVRLGSRDALELRWRGSYDGHDMRAGMQVLLLDGFVLGAFTFSTAERFEQRARTMAEVLRTVGYERPAGDPRLVGSWRYTKTYVSGSFSSITERHLTLRADGTCVEDGNLRAGMEHVDAAGDPTGSSSGSADGTEARGRWRVQGDRIVLVWDGGGSETWGFVIDGSSMLWRDGSSKKLWHRTR